MMAENNVVCAARRRFVRSVSTAYGAFNYNGGECGGYDYGKWDIF